MFKGNRQDETIRKYLFFCPAEQYDAYGLLSRLQRKKNRLTGAGTALDDAPRR